MSGALSAQGHLAFVLNPGGSGSGGNDSIDLDALREVTGLSEVAGGGLRRPLVVVVVVVVVDPHHRPLP